MFILSFGNKNCISNILILISKSSGLSLSEKSPLIDFGLNKFKFLPTESTFSLLSPDAIQTLIPALCNFAIEYFKSFGVFSSKNKTPMKINPCSYSIAKFLKCSSLLTT